MGTIAAREILRHPTYKQVALTPDVMWRLLVHAIGRMHRERRHEKIGRVLERRLFAILNRVDEQEET